MRSFDIGGSSPWLICVCDITGSWLTHMYTTWRTHTQTTKRYLHGANRSIVRHRRLVSVIHLCVWHNSFVAHSYVHDVTHSYINDQKVSTRRHPVDRSTSEARLRDSSMCVTQLVRGSLICTRRDSLIHQRPKGIYTAPPGRSFDIGGSSPKLLHTFNPDDPKMESIEYGRDQRVGRGGADIHRDLLRICGCVGFFFRYIYRALLRMLWALLRMTPWWSLLSMRFFGGYIQGFFADVMGSFADGAMIILSGAVSWVWFVEMRHIYVYGYIGLFCGYIGLFGGWRHDDIEWGC